MNFLTFPQFFSSILFGLLRIKLQKVNSINLFISMYIYIYIYNTISMTKAKSKR